MCQKLTIPPQTTTLFICSGGCSEKEHAFHPHPRQFGRDKFPNADRQKWRAELDYSAKRIRAAAEKESTASHLNADGRRDVYSAGPSRTTRWKRRLLSKRRGINSRCGPAGRRQKIGQLVGQIVSAVRTLSSRANRLHINTKFHLHAK